jgi:hypothetical protein
VAFHLPVCRTLFLNLCEVLDIYENGVQDFGRHYKDKAFAFLRIYTKKMNRISPHSILK